MKTNPFFTIITVTYNAQDKIVRTINSVLKQTCDDYEYILIDGKSKDNTSRLIADHIKTFEERGISYRIVEEKDNGIYDAMNKGIYMANGKWLCFLNAGDFFYDKNTLLSVKESHSDDNRIGVIYGDRLYYKQNGLTKYEKAKDLDYITVDIPFSHQSTFSRIDLLKRHPFDLNYQISADYEFFMWCYYNNIGFEYLDKTLSINEHGGFSTIEENEISMLRENIELKRKYGIYDENNYRDEIIKLEKYSKYRSFTAKIKEFIPKKLLERRTYLLNLKKGWVKGV